MRPLSNFLRVLSDGEVEQLHQEVLKLLENPGMKIENEKMLEALHRKGAEVDFSAEVVKFPRELVEETIGMAKKDEEERVKKKEGNIHTESGYPDQLTFSWHTPFRNRTPSVQASLGGGAPLYYDHKLKVNRYATGKDFLRTIHLAEGISEIITVGNAVHYLSEEDGTAIPPKMVALKGAAAVAKNSSKPGCTSIIDRRQLPYLMELGRIVKGSAEEYLKSPIFVNIHDTESPLRLTRPEAGIIEAMAKEKLSIFILPMPLAGISTPVYPISASIVGAAEILGVWVATKALNPDAPVQASCVSGVLNPATGTASFSTPEAILIDTAVAQLFREKYGVQCSTGTGIIDAPLPGELSIFERTFKTLVSSLAGEPTYPIGILGGGVVHSIEQIILDLDIASSQSQLTQGIGGSHFSESLELIRERGISGLFIDTDHTALNYRDCLMIPRVLKRLKSTDINTAAQNNPVELAHNRCIEILSSTQPYHIDEYKARAIDKITEDAHKELSSITGAEK